MSKQSAQFKIDRYGWTPLDNPGRFAWINKHDLIVPVETYQRTGTENKERRIAANFSWAAFQVLSVASNGDGFYSVIEGGHRHRASMMRDDIVNLPCLIFDLPDVRKQAEAFLQINKERKPMSGIDRHEAMLVAGDVLACKVQNLCDLANLKVSKGNNEKGISCINEMALCIRENEALFNDVWPLIVDVCAGHRITRDMLVGLFYVARYVDGGITSASRRRRIMDVGYDDLYQGSRQGREFHGHPGSSAIADGMLNRINKGLRNKWEWRNDKA
jgi:hypothetical protein